MILSFLILCCRVLTALILPRIIKADKQKANIPIVMVTAKAEEADKVAGLEIGADHYVTKAIQPA